MLPSNSKTSIKQLLRWGLCAVALLGGLAQAQTTRPRIPELTCTSHPAILNTAISGANGYSNSSLPINPGETDEHWDYASSRIDYPTNIGTDYPTQNLGKLCKTNESRRCSSPTAVHAVLTQIFC